MARDYFGSSTLQPLDTFSHTVSKNSHEVHILLTDRADLKAIFALLLPPEVQQTLIDHQVVPVLEASVLKKRSEGHRGSQFGAGAAQAEEGWKMFLCDGWRYLKALRRKVALDIH